MPILIIVLIYQPIRSSRNVQECMLFNPLGSFNQLYSAKVQSIFLSTVKIENIEQSIHAKRVEIMKICTGPMGK